MKKQQTANDLVVGGLTPLTTIDYPGELAAVIFFQGCPWRCGYCQNSELLSGKKANSISWIEIISFLEKRKGLLDAVVFSGGEPTMQAGLLDAIQQVKAMGFKIGLHSAGVYPERLQAILPLIDWIGLDIKAAQMDYHFITQSKRSGERAWKSAKLVINSGVKYELRTTVHADLLDKKCLLTLVDELSEIGAENYVVQNCITKNCLEDKLRVLQKNHLSDEFIKKCTNSFKEFSVRRA